MNRAGAKNLDLGKTSSNRAAPIGRAGHLPQNAAFFWILGALSLCSTAASAQMKSLGEKDTVAAAKLPAIEIDKIINAVKQPAYDVPKSWSVELRFRRVIWGLVPASLFKGRACSRNWKLSNLGFSQGQCKLSVAVQE